MRYRILALIITILGTGLDIIPITKLNDSTIRHIEVWSHKINSGLVVNNTYTSFLWVPQHTLAAISLIYICNILVSKKQTILEKISIPLGFLFITLTSVFVAMTAIAWIGIIFLIKKHSRKNIFLHALVAGILAIPYIMQLRDRNNLFYFYSPKFFTYIQNNDWLNRLINIIVDYGPITIIAIILTWMFLKPLKARIAVLIGVLAPILITWFIRTPGPNDFGMRSVLPAQLIIPIMLCYSLDKIKSKKATALILIIVCFNLLVSGYGFIFEHYKSWKNRQILTVQDSHLLLWVRNLPKDIKLASYQKEDWSFYIPSIGFKANLTPHLHDSGVYISGKSGFLHADYEILAREIFDNQTMANDINSLITQKESQWRNLNKYFSWHPFDYFVITQKEWVKKGINPWYFIFKQMDIPINEIGHDFVYFKYEDLVNITNKKTPKIAQDKIQKLTVADNQFLLTEGLWYIVACKDISRERIVLSLSDYFALIDHKFPGKGCAGNTLVAIDNEPIKLDNGFSFDSLYAIPVFIDNI